MKILVQAISIFLQQMMHLNYLASGASCLAERLTENSLAVKIDTEREKGLL